MGGFEAHVELLRLFLTRRKEIVESIAALLNAQRTTDPPPDLPQQFEDCFFGVADSQALRGELEADYCAEGFTPRAVQHLHNDLAHPVELMMRGVHCWQQTHWPGRGDRVHYAHTLFNLYVLRCLEFLSLRLRLPEIQGLLDELWRSSPVGQPAFVRDARWLIPLAQSLITDELAPYFEMTRKVTETLSEADALEVQRAHVRMLGGHLCSQIRHYCTRDGLAIEDRSVVLRTRTSNALDLALLVQGLVALLGAYERAVQSGDERVRIAMAGAIFQGISPDPELFLNRVELLGAYSMIEGVFIATDPEGRVAYSPQGERHVRLLHEYGALIGRLMAALRDDFPRFRPVDGGFSSYGVMFGLPTTLIEHMALKAVQRDAETRFSVEDLFDDDTSAAKLAWVNGWRQLPHVPREVQRSFDFPQSFAEDIYNRIERELGRHGSGARTGHLYLASAPTIEEVPAQYFASSSDPAQVLRDRQEGHFLVSYETTGGWVALRKEVLTEVLGAGRDVRIGGLPGEGAEVLRLMCGELVRI